MNERWKDKFWRDPDCKPSFGELLGNVLVENGIDVDKMLEDLKKKENKEELKNGRMDFLRGLSELR